MKIYKVKPEKRRGMSGFELKKGPLLILLVLLTAGMFYLALYPESAGSRYIFLISVKCIVWFITFCLLIMPEQKTGRTTTSSRDDIAFIKDSGRLYYITLRQSALTQRNSLGEFNIFHRIAYNPNADNNTEARDECRKLIQSSQLEYSLTKILYHKMDKDIYNAINAYPVERVVRLKNSLNGIDFVFYARNNPTALRGYAYDYMNDYEELVELIKSKKV